MTARRPFLHRVFVVLWLLLAAGAATALVLTLSRSDQYQVDVAHDLLNVLGSTIGFAAFVAVLQYLIIGFANPLVLVRRKD